LNKQSTSEFSFSFPELALTWRIRLLVATPPSEDAVQILMTAGRRYFPVDHAVPPADKVIKSIPLPNERPSIEQVIFDMTNSLWYLDQIVHRQKVDARVAQTG
jgi:DEAD/DEAH box helicase domain-containing protein